MASPTVSRGWVLAGLAVAVIVVLGLAHVISTRPWDTARNATCDQLFQAHVTAQAAYLSAPSGPDAQLQAERDGTYAELGVTCGWEEAQAADMTAHAAVPSSAPST